MARELNAFGIDQDIHARPVEGSTEGVRVQRLTPLVVGFLVAMCTVGGIGKGARLDEIIAFHLYRPRKKKLIPAEAKVIGITYFSGILLPIGLLAEDT
jgi:hypothetical protein